MLLPDQLNQSKAAVPWKLPAKPVYFAPKGKALVRGQGTVPLLSSFAKATSYCKLQLRRNGTGCCGCYAAALEALLAAAHWVL